jgi:hypothetical protein
MRRASAAAVVRSTTATGLSCVWVLAHWLPMVDASDVNSIPAPSAEPSAAEVRAAQLANVLARAVRDGEVAVPDALRVLRHELRRRNTNKKLKIVTRSRRAQEAIEKYGETAMPKNDSDDALHADHVYPLTEDSLRRTDTVERWIEELKRIQMVVCVTADENYRLEAVERSGITGPLKYAEAGVVFTSEDLPWAVGS